ncbi:MAG TPA: hypothetical protein VMT79_18800, partial [Candidatus Binatia bacterium]|nr:hypothetical protein [Candidatus Binatia bacterium]
EPVFPSGRGRVILPGVMRWRACAVIVLAYVALDFANPMMPGAVQLLAGSLSAVEADRSRGEGGPESAVAVAPTRAPMAGVSPPAIRKERPRDLGTPWRPPQARRAGAPSDDSPVAPDH